MWEMKEVNRICRARLLEYLSEQGYGTMISYNDLRRALGRHPRDPLHCIRTDVYWVNKQLMATANRALENVRGWGYRIVEPREHVALALRQKKFAARRLRRAAKILAATNAELLTAEEAEKLERTKTLLVAQALPILRKRITAYNRVQRAKSEVKRVMRGKAAVDLEERIAALEAALAGVNQHQT